MPDSTRLSSISRDVTTQKEVSQQSAQYSRSLIEASLDPLVTISPDGKITDVNAATLQVTGAARNHLHRHRSHTLCGRHVNVRRRLRAWRRCRG